MRAFVGALLLALAGFLFLALPYFLDTSPSEQNIRGFLRDIGSALLISGLLGAIFEYSSRRGFIAQVEESLSDVITKRYSILEEARESGVDSIYSSLPDGIEKKFQQASSIRVLQTWIGNLDRIADSLRKAANNNCTVQILLLDPNSVQARYRSKDQGENETAAKQRIEINLNHLERLMSEPNTRGNIEVRTYDATPTMTIYGYDNIDIVGLYWRKKAAISFPQLMVNRQKGQERPGLWPKEQEGTGLWSRFGRSSGENGEAEQPYFAQAVREHFEDLWGEASIFAPGDDAGMAP
ncbi:MAG TPA: DUF5919 domain-containing protein [Rubrobacter sp.]|nr:DUF5919 domain-containing protein [Rubrobacter sp.]